MDIDPSEIQAKGIFPNKPFEKSFTKEIINAIKNDDDNMVGKLLHHNKYLVYGYDYTRKTPLHWATIRGKYKLMQCLLENHSDPDA